MSRESCVVRLLRLRTAVGGAGLADAGGAAVGRQERRDGGGEAAQGLQLPQGVAQIRQPDPVILCARRLRRRTNGSTA
ncbi:MAG: hypothetical protein QME96_17170 [Myxococcota bacterium]|nr:hypothetical protein [Myxococcota bacterium]